MFSVPAARNRYAMSCRSRNNASLLEAGLPGIDTIALITAGPTGEQNDFVPTNWCLSSSRQLEAPREVTVHADRGI